jgi:hypothetical protein
MYPTKLSKQAMGIDDEASISMNKEIAPIKQRANPFSIQWQ